jgi:hypothetical protein
VTSLLPLRPMRCLVLLLLLLLPTAAWAQEGDAPAGDAPADEAPEDGPADEAPAEEAPAKQAPSGEAPADEPAAEAADEPAPSDEPAETVDNTEAQKILDAMAQDSLGRPFPHPDVLRVTKRWRAGGYALTGAGAALLVGGLTGGSALARNADLDAIADRVDSDNPFANPPPPGAILVGGLVGGGGALLLTGVPLLSSGEFATRQLLRTIKGAEKVPRTTANEIDYWQACMDAQYAQGTSIGGGFLVAFGVLSTVAVGALVGTDRYQPEFWLIPVGVYAAGGTMLAVGLATTKKARARMEAVRDATDPLRQAPSLSMRMQSFGPLVDVRDGQTTLGWSLSATF